MVASDILKKTPSEEVMLPGQKTATQTKLRRARGAPHEAALPHKPDLEHQGVLLRVHDRHDRQPGGGGAGTEQRRLLATRAGGRGLAGYGGDGDGPPDGRQAGEDDRNDESLQSRAPDGQGRDRGGAQSGRAAG